MRESTAPVSLKCQVLTSFSLWHNFSVTPNPAAPHSRMHLPSALLAQPPSTRHTRASLPAQPPAVPPLGIWLPHPRADTACGFGCTLQKTGDGDANHHPSSTLKISVYPIHSFFTEVLAPLFISPSISTSKISVYLGYSLVFTGILALHSTIHSCQS